MAGPILTHVGIVQHDVIMVWAWMHWPVGSMDVIMVWAWMHWPTVAMDVIMAWAWMHWPMDGFAAWTLRDADLSDKERGANESDLA